MTLVIAIRSALGARFLVDTMSILVRRTQARIIRFCYGVALERVNGARGGDGGLGEDEQRGLRVRRQITGLDSLKLTIVGVLN